MNTEAQATSIAAQVTAANVPVKAKAKSTKKSATKAKSTKKSATKAKSTKKSATKAPKAVDRLVPADLTRYVKDTEHKTANGNASIHCDDAVARKLLGKDLAQCYAIAAKAINESEKALKAKYGHLNPGMQRMNLGNRMRGAAV